VAPPSKRGAHDRGRAGAALLALLLATVASHSATAGTNAFPIPLVAQTPTGSLVYAGTDAGAISAPGSTNTYLIDLDGGQSLTVVTRPAGASLQPVAALASTAGTLGVATADVAGADAVLQTIAIQRPGTMAIDISASGGSTGAYSLAVLLNCASEQELHGVDNGSAATAQDLTGSRYVAAPGADRLAVRGALGSPTPTVVAEEHFASNTLGSAWQWYRSDFNGRLFVTTSFGVQAGPYALWMDRSPTGAYTLNEAVWTVDVSGLSAAELRFFQAEWEDEENSMPTNHIGLLTNFVGHVNADGVAISDDGTHWHTVYSPTNQSDATWSQITVDLAEHAASAGMVLSSNFLIKFQQYDDFPLKSDGRGYDEITITTPAADQDCYSFQLTGGDHLTCALAESSGTNAALELFAADGISLLAADQPTGQVGRAIDDYVAPSNGIYFARITGTNENYLLQLGRNASLEREPNNNADAAQSLNGWRAVLGDANGDVDEYSIAAASGQVIVATTRTPGGGPFAPVNTLDPIATLLAPDDSALASADNSAPDFRNLSLVVAAATTGTYRVSVSATNATTGEYVLCLAAVDPTADADADGLPDYWELAHGLNPRDDGSVDPVNGPNADPDHDSVVNLAEFRAGTSPNDASSAFAVTRVRERAGTNGVEITVATEHGGAYTMEFTDDSLMGMPVWTNFANTANGAGAWLETGASPSVHTFLDDGTTSTSGRAPAGGHRAYRVRVDAP
jgi:hypothetical protein